MPKILRREVGGGFTNLGRLWIPGFNANSMIHSSNSESLRQPFVPCIAEMDEENVALGKRLKLVSDNHSKVSTENVHERPGQLGLRLTKNDSLLNSIHRRLSQQNSSSAPSIARGEIHEAVHPEKVKASNFSASLLRIGSWEHVSRREGDLVAKFYYAKHKLVWEVLDGTLKSKFEFQSSEIVALKATLPEDGPGTLEIVISLVGKLADTAAPSAQIKSAFAEYVHPALDHMEKEGFSRSSDKLFTPPPIADIRCLEHDFGGDESSDFKSEGPHLTSPVDSSRAVETLEDLRSLLMNDFHPTCAAEKDSSCRRCPLCGGCVKDWMISMAIAPLWTTFARMVDQGHLQSRRRRGFYATTRKWSTAIRISCLLDGLRNKRKFRKNIFPGERESIESEVSS
ncbi:hypothetical protein HPP92_021634 [Vanilla planifolia]|uniref:TRF2/HOY1 PH-like domain-containing protein n=1 Tax=Vanilla planifolia TaxID=51239 RepID=A0A835Q619_VANPL|nr:hypothetical protein HPP92_021634 [Vanilla planifolia]